MRLQIKRTGCNQTILLFYNRYRVSVGRDTTIYHRRPHHHHRSSRDFLGGPAQHCVGDSRFGSAVWPASVLLLPHRQIRLFPMYKDGQQAKCQVVQGLVTQINVTLQTTSQVTSNLTKFKMFLNLELNRWNH